MKREHAALPEPRDDYRSLLRLSFEPIDHGKRLLDLKANKMPAQEVTLAVHPLPMRHVGPDAQTIGDAEAGPARHQCRDDHFAARCEPAGIQQAFGGLIRIWKQHHARMRPGLGLDEDALAVHAIEYRPANPQHATLVRLAKQGGRNGVAHEFERFDRLARVHHPESGLQFFTGWTPRILGLLDKP